MREEVTEGRRKIHNEELHNPLYSPNIRAIKSRRTRLAGHVACTRVRNAQMFLLAKTVDPRGKTGF
jgi:hypothetical protein